MEIKITKKRLSFKEAISFIENVVEGSFIVDEETGETSYDAYIGQLALKSAFLKYYTDYTFPEDMEENYLELISFDINSHLYEILESQYQDILSAIQSEISFRKEKILKEQTDEFSKLLRLVSTKISSIDLSELDFKAISEYINKLNESDLPGGKTQFKPNTNKKVKPMQKKNVTL